MLTVNGVGRQAFYVNKYLSDGRKKAGRREMENHTETGNIIT